MRVCVCVCVCKAVVLGVLLYGSETWTTKRAVARKLEAFHNRCLRGILGITSVQQRLQHIRSSVQVAKQFGMDIHDSVEETEMAWPLG